MANAAILNGKCGANPRQMCGSHVLCHISHNGQTRSETGTSFKQALFFKEIGFNLHDTMIFQKSNPIPQIYRKRYNGVFEYMFVFSKGKVKTHNPIKVDCLHAGLELKGTTYKNYSKGEQKRGKFANPVKKQKIKVLVLFLLEKLMVVMFII